MSEFYGILVERALTSYALEKTIEEQKAENVRLRQANARYKNLMGWLEAVDFESIGRAVELAKIDTLESEG